MRKEVLQDEMIFNCFRALQNDMTDFGIFEHELEELIIKTVSEKFSDELSYDMDREAEHDFAEVGSGYTIRFFQDEECVLVVEVVAQ